MSTIPHLKRCTKCGETKLLDQFRKGKGYADGYRSKCKACLNAENREYSRQPDAQEQRRVRERVYKQRPEVKARVLAYMQRPDVNERVKERERQRWQTDEHLREYKRVYIRERYRNNPEHKRKQFEHSNAAIHARRARKQANGGSYSAKEWRELCAKYDHRCLCCNEQKPLTVDHVLPLSLGGDNSIGNIQPLCLACNLRKHAKHVDYRP